MGRSRVRGAAKLRRLMKRMPGAVQQEIVGELERGGQEIVPVMRGRTPRRFGALQAGISHKVFAKTMKLQVGLIGTKRGRAKLFYGYILDRGRKAQTVTVVRGTTKSKSFSAVAARAAGKTLRKPYLMRVKQIPAMRFVSGSYKDLRVKINQNLKDIWGRALKRVSGGAE